MEAIMNFNLDGQATKRLLVYLQNLYIDMLKEHSDLRREEKIRIDLEYVMRIKFRRQSL